MLVMQASGKPSPKQPLGQRREFIPCRRSADTSSGDGHEPGTDIHVDRKFGF
jgi:hypothetical protein